MGREEQGSRQSMGHRDNAFKLARSRSTVRALSEYLHFVVSDARVARTTERGDSTLPPPTGLAAVSVFSSLWKHMMP